MKQPLSVRDVSVPSNNAGIFYIWGKTAVLFPHAPEIQARNKNCSHA